MVRKGHLGNGKEVYEYSGYTYGCISPSGIAVSDQPEMSPFYEMPADSVSWDGDILTLPTDTVRVAQLQAKLEEYKQRLKQSRQGEGDTTTERDSICKIAVLEPLLANGKIDLDLVRKQVMQEYGDCLPYFHNAFGVIADYCDTGGINVWSGTGLKPVEAVE